MHLLKQTRTTCRRECEYHSVAPSSVVLVVVYVGVVVDVAVVLVVVVSASGAGCEP